MRTLTIVLAICLSVARASAATAVMLGAFVNNQGDIRNFFDPQTAEQRVTDFETAYGGKLAIDSQYTLFGGFSTANPPQQAVWDIANGRTPQITWKNNLSIVAQDCAKAADIVNGVYDDQLVDQAATISALGRKVLIRFWPGMDFQGCPYTVDPQEDPQTAGAEFVAVWRHVVDIFHSHGAANAMFVWSPNMHSFGDNQGNPLSTWSYFYPGDGYVDWFGTSHYNTQSVLVDFQTPLFKTWYATVSLKGKPLIFSEFGAQGADPQVDQNGWGCRGVTIGGHPSPAFTWMQSLGTSLYNYPAINAVVWFDSLGKGGPTGCLNLIMRGDGMSEFVHLHRDLPRFQGGPLQ